MAKGKRSVDPEAATKRIMRQQLNAFRKKFGRDPLPDEPVYFDPDQDVPTEMSEAKLREDMLKVVAEGPPQFAYAYAKTGLLLMEGQEEHYPPEAIAEWKAAIDEYFRLEGEGKQQGQGGQRGLLCRRATVQRSMIRGGPYAGETVPILQ